MGCDGYVGLQMVEVFLENAAMTQGISRIQILTIIFGIVSSALRS